MGVVIIIQEIDDRGGGPVDRSEEGRAQPGGAADDHVDGAGPALLEDLPAAVGIAEASLQGAGPGHGRFARDASHAEDLDVQPLADRRRPGLLGVQGVAVERRPVSPAANQPVGDGAQPAGEGGLYPEHVERVLSHLMDFGLVVRGISSIGSSDDSTLPALRSREPPAIESKIESRSTELTRRSERTPCWRRPSGGRSRDG